MQSLLPNDALAHCPTKGAGDEASVACGG